MGAKLKILHVVTETERINGYTQRTRGLVAAQRRAGADALVTAAFEGNWPAGPFDLIHAHTPWKNARLADLLCDLGHCSRWIYEVRGLQHESAVTDGRWDRLGAQFRNMAAAELWAIQEADGVFAIGPGLVQHAESRRNLEDVHLTPNAVDPETFKPISEARRTSVRKTYRLPEHAPIVGYFGSLRPLEGIDELIRAMPYLLGLHPDARCLIVGDGSNRGELIGLASELGVQRSMEWRGPFMPEVIPELTAAVDCVAITRPRSLVTETVTPLKPLEALACSVPVVSSDLPALRYVGEAGTLFYPPGDLRALALALSHAFAEGACIGAQGCDWVRSARTWDRVAATQIAAYEEILS